MFQFVCEITLATAIVAAVLLLPEREFDQLCILLYI